MVVVVLEWGKAGMFTKENYINANERLMGGWRGDGGDGGADDWRRATAERGTVGS